MVKRASCWQRHGHSRKVCPLWRSASSILAVPLLAACTTTVGALPPGVTRDDVLRPALDAVAAAGANPIGGVIEVDQYRSNTRDARRLRGYRVWVDVSGCERGAVLVVMTTDFQVRSIDDIGGCNSGINQ